MKDDISCERFLEVAYQVASSTPPNPNDSFRQGSEQMLVNQHIICCEEQKPILAV